jgi:hypothetical protein
MGREQDLELAQCPFLRLCLDTELWRLAFLSREDCVPPDSTLTTRKRVYQWPDVWMCVESAQVLPQ